MPNVLQRFRSENRIPGFFRKGHVLQADRSLFKVDRIHTEFSIVQFNDGIDWQIFLSAEILCLRMGFIFLLAGQIDALTLLPELHCLRSPLFTRETRYLNFAECSFFFQNFCSQKCRNALCIFTVELKVSVLLITDQRIRVTLFQRVILGGSIQRQGLQGRLNGLFFRCIRNHNAAHPLRCVLAILIQCNGIPSVRNNVLIGALENIFYQPVFEVFPVLACFQIQRSSFRILL